MFETIVQETWGLYREAAPWLVLGLVAAGLIKAWMPDGALNRWLGGSGPGPVVKAALIGAPLPLCSCGVLPAAVELRREGASKGATVSFLIATPETGPDSVAVSYVLLGPVMAVVRPIAAVTSAVFAGSLAGWLTRNETDVAAATASCSSDSCCAAKPQPPSSPLSKTWIGFAYAATDIMDDIAPWLVFGLIVAGVMNAVIPAQAVAEVGSGLPAMLAMVVVGIPVYVCATASTPIAAALLSAGLSPGVVLVFLLAGPATNAATIAVVGRELGKRAVAAYLTGIAVSAVVLGLVLDTGLAAFGLDVSAQMAAVAETVPEIVALGCAVVLAPFMAWPILRMAKSRAGW